MLVALGRLLARPLLRQVRRFERHCLRPEVVQRELLLKIVRHHASTGFGHDHGFDRIASVEDFRRHVSLGPYERLAPYIDRVARGETNALLNAPKVLMFALTSGTTAARKLIPITDQYLVDYKRGWQMWGVRNNRDHWPRGIAMRPIVQMVGDPDEFRSVAGIPCGNLTGFTAKIQMKLVRRLFAVPALTGRIKDPRARNYTALRFSIGRPVAQFLAANPSTLLQLARTLDAEKALLVKDLHDGTLSTSVDIPDVVRQQLCWKIKANPVRTRELEAIINRSDRLYPQDVWSPQRVIIGTWTGGSMGPYLKQLPRYFGNVPVRDLGLLASEGRMTIPLADGTASGVLDIASHYFEFIPEGEIESTSPVVLGAHELEEGKSYFIVPTTAAGLYRYQISDLVRVTGFLGRTPMVDFLGKGNRFANLTGEKLSEHHVTAAVAAAQVKVPIVFGTYSLVPRWDDVSPHYGFTVEASDVTDAALMQRFIIELDHALGVQNVEYESKRSSARLGPVRLVAIPPGAWAAWDRAKLAERGGAAEQYKHPCLLADAKLAPVAINEF